MVEATYDMYAMYDSDDVNDSENTSTVSDQLNMSINQAGVYTEIIIGNQKAKVIDPMYVMRLESKNNLMARQIQALQTQQRSIQSALNSQAAEIRSMRGDLDSKVSYR